MSRLIVSFCGALVALASTAASAQVFYEPVQYQYFAGGRAYYYGGHDWRVHARANQLSHEPGYGRTNGYARMPERAGSTRRCRRCAGWGCERSS